MKKNFAISTLFALAALAALAAVWIAAYYAVGNEYFLPSLWDTIGEAGRLLTEAVFWRDLGYTLLRTVAAFLFSFVAGCALAALASLHPAVRAFFAPVVSVLRTVPTMAIILILIIWTNRTVAPAIVALLVLLPAVYAAALAEIEGIKGEYGEFARAFRVSAGRRIFKMYLPLAAPNLLAQAGSVLSMGLKITVSGEVLSQTFRSVGYLMQQAQIGLDMSRLFALTLIVIALGFLLEGACCGIRYALVRRRR